MKFSQPLVFGHLLKRYKRFLADVTLDSGETVIAHCTNTGSMKSCIEEGARVGLTPVNDPKRKTKFTWEIIELNGAWVGVNTMVPNRFGFEAVQANEIPTLENYTTVKREVTYGDSRLDLQLLREDEICFVEIKNVTYKSGDLVIFPDAVSTRGLKHLESLIQIKKEGHRAVMLCIVQRSDINAFAPAWEVDPAYAEKMIEAEKQGVEILPIQVEVTELGVEFKRVLPYILERIVD